MEKGERLLRYLGSLVKNARSWARTIKRDVVALWLAAKDNRVPLTAKLVAGVVAAYALSPIDLIPDFIPVLGYLDDVIIVPLGILLAIRMVPSHLMDEFRREAATHQRPISKSGLIAVIAIWTLMTLLAASLIWNHFTPRP